MHESSPWQARLTANTRSYLRLSFDVAVIEDYTGQEFERHDLRHQSNSSTYAACRLYSSTNFSAEMALFLKQRAFLRYARSNTERSGCSPPAPRNLATITVTPTVAERGMLKPLLRATTCQRRAARRGFEHVAGTLHMLSFEDMPALPVTVVSTTDRACRACRACLSGLQLPVEIGKVVGELDGQPTNFPSRGPLQLRGCGIVYNFEQHGSDTAKRGKQPSTGHCIPSNPANPFVLADKSLRVHSGPCAHSNQQLDIAQQQA